MPASLPRLRQLQSGPDFSAGQNGRAIQTALRVVRRDWPHLQWWRAVKDDGQLSKGSEHEEKLLESGFSIAPVDGKDDVVSLELFQEMLMEWDDETEDAVRK